MRVIVNLFYDIQRHSSKIIDRSSDNHSLDSTSFITSETKIGEGGGADLGKLALNMQKLPL